MTCCSAKVYFVWHSNLHKDYFGEEACSNVRKRNNYLQYLHANKIPPQKEIIIRHHLKTMINVWTYWFLQVLMHHHCHRHHCLSSLAWCLLPLSPPQLYSLLFVDCCLPPPLPPPSIFNRIVVVVPVAVADNQAMPGPRHSPCRQSLHLFLSQCFLCHHCQRLHHLTAAASTVGVVSVSAAAATYQPPWSWLVTAQKSILFDILLNRKKTILVRRHAAMGESGTPICICTWVSVYLRANKITQKTRNNGALFVKTQKHKWRYYAKIHILCFVLKLRR